MNHILRTHQPTQSFPGLRDIINKRFKLLSRYDSSPSPGSNRPSSCLFDISCRSEPGAPDFRSSSSMQVGNIEDGGRQFVWLGLINGVVVVVASSSTATARRRLAADLGVVGFDLRLKLQ